MISNKEILDLVAQYVKTHNLDEFAASFAQVFYDIEDTGDTVAIQLAYEIESLLAALTAGVCTEPAFYEAMKSISPSVVLYEVNVDKPKQGTVILSDQPLTHWVLVGVVAGSSGHVGISPSAGFWSTTAPQGKLQTNTDPLPSQQVITE